MSRNPGDLSLPLAHTDKPGAPEGVAKLLAQAHPHGTADNILDAPDPWPEMLAATAQHSPYLAKLIARERTLVAETLARGPDAGLTALLEETRALPPTRAAFMPQARGLKHRAALLIALADLAGIWPLERVTYALSDVADHLTQVALNVALTEAVGRGDLGQQAVADGAHGLFVLGMGKLGAYELNYSSDIDLIVLYDGARFAAQGQKASVVAARLVRTLTHLLSEVTREGYVFRTDLRLSPNTGVQHLALSTAAAETYYEVHGQNWERAALVKARVIAGDAEAGAGFIRYLQPFLWRRHLDYAAIDDIRSIKRQIDAHKRHGDLKLLGHDIKVGRGGIREIEFFAQTQQLILGGRHPSLRVAPTLAALDALVEGAWLADHIRDELRLSYRLLRNVEHRLQMREDRQTHTLPAAAEDLRSFARFCGFPDPQAFEDTLLTQMKRVAQHFGNLFEHSPSLAVDGPLAFTGQDDDAPTLATLRGLGFHQPENVSERIRAWHRGTLRATRSARAREVLTEITPALLAAMGQTLDPDETFRRFDRFVAELPEGVQPFSLLKANDALFELLMTVMGSAPALAAKLSQDAGLFETMLQSDFLEPLPDQAGLRRELDQRLTVAPSLQDALDAARRYGHAQQFQLGLQVLFGALDPQAAQAALTDQADVLVKAMLDVAERWLSQSHGAVPGGGFAVIGLGKLGSKELNFGSDLDLIFVYTAPDEARSDGARSLSAREYYSRLAQRLVSALSAQTPEGKLYDIDLRLRPSGNAGPVVLTLTSFARYQRETAAIWEQQALTRGRVVASVGTGDLPPSLETAIEEALRRPRDPAQLAVEISAMRERVFREHGSQDLFNLKHVRGGLVDVEFLLQFVQLRHAEAEPELLQRAVLPVLRAAEAKGLLTRDDVIVLRDATKLYHALLAILRLTTGYEHGDDLALPTSLRRAILQAARTAAPQLDDFAALRHQLASTQAQVAAMFTRIVTADPVGV